MKTIFLKTSLAMIVLLTACGPPKHVATLSQDDLASIKLAESADAVSRTLIDLARIEEVATPPAKGAELPNPNTWGMREVASLDWSGPIEPAIKQIAESSHYHVRVLGHEPAVPIIVTIVARDVPLGTLLRDVAFQAGKRAKV